MLSFARLFKFFQFSLIFYVSIAVLYTTNYLLISPLQAALSVLLSLHPLSPRSLWASFTSSASKPDRRTQEARAYNLEPRFLRFSGGDTKWESSLDALEHGLGHLEPVLVDEELTLSKAFSGSMRPSKIIPYFYRANGNFHLEDITITTLVTNSRFQAFSRLVERYQGPISVTVHVKNTMADIRDLLKSLRSLYATSKSMATYVDVHLVIDPFDREFNTWRNIARLFARTDYVMMLDVDFYLCTDFRTAMKNTPHIMDKLRGGKAAFVVPAFEYAKYTDGIDHSAFPKDKRALLGLVKSNRLGMFHASWAPGHNSTDYKRVYAAPPGDVYKVTQYHSAYEPYVIFKKEGPPWSVVVCDERFVGYGGNKAACLFEMYISGISYFVLADHFIIHQSHRYEEPARKNERRYNRKIYTDFKEETCLRYLKMFQDNGLLNTTQGSNALQECKSRKRAPAPRLATEVLKPPPPMVPKVLICGSIVWAHDDVKRLLGDIAEVVYLDVKDRSEFLAAFKPGGKYSDVVGIYRENGSADIIGVFDKEIINGLSSSVKWIAHNGAGYDPVDVHACIAKGIYLSNTPGAVDDATATTALYLLISTLRQYSIAERSLREGKWKPAGLAKQTRDITGRTLAILGLGGIGLRFAELAHAFPMRIIYHSRRKAENAPSYCEYFENVEEMLAQADVLSVHVPLRAETVGLVGEKWIRALKPGAIIINTARGKVIDEEAMIRALEDGHLASVGLDVFPNEPEVNPRLLQFPNITLLPHMGTENQDSQRKMEVRALQNLRDYFTTGMGQDLVIEWKNANKANLSDWEQYASTAAADAEAGGRLSNSDAAKLANVMQHTLGELDTTLNTFNQQASIFDAGINLQVDRTAEIEELRKRLSDHAKVQSQFIRGAKRTIREDFKRTVSDRLRSDISAQIRREVAFQVKEQVDLQIRDHIPVPLEQQAIDNKRQISEIKVALANSEARAKNSHLQVTNLDEPLVPILKPDGSRSKLFPADLRSLFSYDLDMAKALVIDFDLEEDDSLQVNHDRFMRHIGIEL
ncbi:putative D-isomer specific 2-hydroxyacid dehydrogenase family protein [Lyophyllum shimeji]|uniref:D-isomer specific 2-hydroxyacid dehydrogenase family protein n=1 Tax=Lyophyllum shimeji TaxID=47721 RepID=A0A9P3PK80_LYOSH|nr:putative D-isomer specific 2-hydroxyacid dehydrogenase family protein [Lyophyllum shimeji]